MSNKHVVLCRYTTLYAVCTDSNRQIPRQNLAPSLTSPAACLLTSWLRIPLILILFSYVALTVRQFPHVPWMHCWQSVLGLSSKFLMLDSGWRPSCDCISCFKHNGWEVWQHVRNQRGSSLLFICVSCSYTQDCAALQNAKRVIFTVHDMAWTKRRPFFTGTRRDAVFPDASWQISAICKRKKTKKNKTLMRECESQRNKVVVSCERSPLKNHRSE